MNTVELRRPAPTLPLQLADHHRITPTGDRRTFVYDGADTTVAVDVLVRRAGFDVDDVGPHRVAARAARALADTTGPGMRLLLVGLNPSLHAADKGYGFAGPGNRFWAAALASGLVSAPHDSRSALTVDRIGMTDLVKRPTTSARELTAAEYRAGLEELEAICAWLEPSGVCFVGLTGYRAARDRKAIAGVQPGHVGGSSAYVMPNPSGLNAHTSHDDLVGHFEGALALADRCG